MAKTASVPIVLYGSVPLCLSEAVWLRIHGEVRWKSTGFRGTGAMAQASPLQKAFGSESFVRVPAETEHGRSRLTSRVEVTLVWLLGHASTVAPFVVFGVILALSWGALREIRVRDFRAALRALDARWLFAAGLLTAAN